VNSDKAAAVRDSVNACPDIVDADDTGEYSRQLEDRQHGGVEVTFTGEHIHLRDWTFAPAEIEVAGKVGFGDDPGLRPCYEVVVPSITLPGDMHGFVPKDIIHEAAKHDCLVRVSDDGTLRLRDDWQHREESDADGDRCEQCGCTRWRLQDGVPECERCGNTAEVATETSTRELTIGDFE